MDARTTYKCNNKLYICKQAQHNLEKNYQRDEWTSIASAKGNRRVKPCETTRLSTWTESTVRKWTLRSLTKDTYNLVLFFFPRWWNTRPTSDIEALTLTTLVLIHGVGQVFHFKNNLRFQLFEKIRIKEPPGLVIWEKKVRIKDPPVLSIWVYLRESFVTFVLNKDQPNLHPLGTSKRLYTLFSREMYGTCSP